MFHAFQFTTLISQSGVVLLQTIYLYFFAVSCFGLVQQTEPFAFYQPLYGTHGLSAPTPDKKASKADWVSFYANCSCHVLGLL